MIFPDTPITLIDRLKRSDVPAAWESSWEEFFDLYHQAVRICVVGCFRGHGWMTTDDGIVDDVTLRVFVSVCRGRASSDFDPAKGRFRQFLSTVCRRRVVDFIRHHKNDGLVRALESEDLDCAAVDDPFQRMIDTAFNDALLGTLLAALRAAVSPRVFMIFELVKLAGEDASEVADQLGVKRGVVDNSIFKAMGKLREIARDPAIAAEFSS